MVDPNLNLRVEKPPTLRVPTRLMEPPWLTVRSPLASIMPLMLIFPLSVTVTPPGIVTRTPNGIVTESTELIVVGTLEPGGSPHVAGSFQLPFCVAVNVAAWASCGRKDNTVINTTIAGRTSIFFKPKPTVCRSYKYLQMIIIFEKYPTFVL